MNQEKNMESQQEMIEQLKFQTDLLRMAALADRLSGPSVMQQSVEETEAIRVMAELTRTADQTLQR